METPFFVMTRDAEEIFWTKQVDQKLLNVDRKGPKNEEYSLKIEVNY